MIDNEWHQSTKKMLIYWLNNTTLLGKSFRNMGASMINVLNQCQFSDCFKEGKIIGKSKD